MPYSDLSVVIILFLSGIVVGAVCVYVCDVQQRSSKKINKEGAAKSVEGSSSSSDGSDWEEDEDEEEDEEEEEIENLRLKMVFVLHQPTPKMTAPLAATLVSSVAVKLVEERLSAPEEAEGEGKTSHSAEWRRWYVWWKQVGCAKITLKGGSDVAALEAMVEAVRALHLPVRTMTYDQVPQDNSDNNPSGSSLPMRTGIAVIGIGPAPSHKLDSITGKLKLMS